MNIEVLQSQFQAVISTFVLERDRAVANINRLLSVEGDNTDEIIEEMRKLTLAKMNIANTQEEVGKLIQQYQNQLANQAAKAQEATAEKEPEPVDLEKAGVQEGFSQGSTLEGQQ